MIVVNVMFSKGIGGIENSIIYYSLCQLQNGWEVHVITSPGAAIIPPLKKIPGVNVHCLKNLGQWDRWAALKLKKLIRRLEANFVFAHANRATSLCYLSNTLPCQIVPVAHDYSIKKSLKYPFLITTTQHLKHYIVLKGFADSNVFVLPNMIPDPKNSARSPTNINKIPIIGSFGRFVKDKGFHHFIEALHILKERGHSFEAILAGEGKEGPALLTLIKDFALHDHLTIKPWMRPEDFFNAIDIFCLPSIHEPFGIVLIEAFAYQKPVVTTKSEGPSEIAKNEVNALITNIKDPIMLADKLEFLLLNKDYAKQLALKGRDAFEKKYSINIVCSMMKNIVLNLHCEA